MTASPCRSCPFYPCHERQQRCGRHHVFIIMQLRDKSRRKTGSEYSGYIGSRYAAVEHYSNRHTQRLKG